LISLLALIGLSATLGSAQSIDPATCPNSLCRLVAHGRAPDLRFPDFVDLRSRLVAFYGPSYAPAWLTESGITPQALAMVAMLKAADKKGLKPEDYDADLWDEQIAHLDRSQFDVCLTVSVMRYLADLHFGKANPGFFHLQNKYRDFDIPGFLRQKLMLATDPDALLAAAVEPPYEGYKRTQKMLAEYLILARQPDVKLSELPATVEPGSAYSDAKPLAERLQQLGDLPRDQSSESAQYRGALVDAVKRFQSRHGLEPDGRLGKATVEQLNVPLSHRLEQVRLALERWRWVPHSFAHAPIVVNIPEFTLRTLNSSYETDLEMKVVVGSSYENQTPVFSAELGYLTFRPYWNVPNSILQNEMLAKLDKERDYLAVHRYQLINTAERPVPTPHGLTDAMLKGLASGRYRLRQMPGPKCALGLLRFGIPNEHNVYLHDTPSPELFERARRDFSHGCVRVERPVQLAEWSLRGTGSWNTAKIRAAMRGGRTFQVNLKNPVPVLLVYATAIVFRDGSVHFTPDIYHQDALLEDRLAQGYPSRTTE
jgi:murein L,D-transpeptidase YcbB/YkuD